MCKRSRAVVFDLDGVLIRTEHLWRRSYFIAFRRLFGFALPPTDMAALQGQINVEVCGRLIEMSSILRDNDDFEAMQSAYASEVLALMLEGIDPLGEPIPESIEFLRALEATGVLLGLASSSPTVLVHRALEVIGLSGVFSSIVTGSDIQANKPDPDIFIQSAVRLGLPPRYCLVIEDSPVGVQAALKAGMACVMLISSDSPPVDWQDAVRCSALVQDIMVLRLERILPEMSSTK